MLCILKAIVAWVILMLVGTSLIGFIVRGFFGHLHLWMRRLIEWPRFSVMNLDA